MLQKAPQSVVFSLNFKALNCVLLYPFRLNFKLFF